MKITGQTKKAAATNTMQKGGIAYGKYTAA
jgi:hypothetical protein